MKARPDTFQMTLPSGQIVRCWQRQREAIRAEVERFGAVMLLNDEDPEVYRFIPRDSVEYRALESVARPG